MNSLKRMPEEEVRHRIIEGTIDEFNEKGFRFTMDDIAKRLNISKKTIYAVFGDKENLFMQMVESCFGAIKESEKYILENSELSLVEKIEKILVVLPERYQHLDFRLIYEMQEKYPNIFEKIEYRIESDWEPTIQLLEQAMEEGVIKRVPITVVKIMVESSIERFLSSKDLIEDGIAYEDALKYMVQIIMNGLLV